MKHIGIVACSAEGAALCYRTICQQALEYLGEHDHPRVTLDSIPLAATMPYFRGRDMAGVAAILRQSLDTLAGAGADFAICPDNTCHLAFPLLEPSSPLPLLHIVRVVGEEARRLGYKKLGITGTAFLMDGGLYPDMLCREFQIDSRIPDAGARARIQEIIFRQLVNGHYPEESRIYLNRVIGDLARQGCDAVVLACTELPILVRPDDCPLPVLDSTRLLAHGALLTALGREPRK
jgi:aspartate racemase